MGDGIHASVDALVERLTSHGEAGEQCRVAHLLRPQLRGRGRRRVQVSTFEQLQGADYAVAVIGIDSVGRPPCSPAQLGMQRRRSALRELALPALPHADGGRRTQPQVRQRSAQVQPGPPHDNRPATRRQQLVDLDVRTYGVLPGTEAGLDRHARDQPVLERLALGAGGCAREGLEARVDLQGIRGDRDRTLAAIPQALGERDGDGRLAHPRGPEDGEDVGLAHLSGVSRRDRHDPPPTCGSLRLVHIAGKSVLVTGATGGLGHAVARALARQGAELILTGRRADLLEPLAVEVAGRAIVGDLSDRAALDRLIADVGEVDGLVVNAGIPASGLVPEYSVEQIDRALDVNLRAAILLARAVSPAMVARGEGHLLFMSSLAGKVATHRSAIYSATKFGLRGFALGLREDLRTTGVGVSAIFPGPIAEAGMFADTAVGLPRIVGSRSPEDVASAVVEAIERNRAEIDVAPLLMRLGTSLGSVAPTVLATVNRVLGAESIAAQVADSESQRSKR